MRTFVAVCLFQALLVAYTEANYGHTQSFGHNQYATGYGVHAVKPSFVHFVKEKFAKIKMTNSGSDSSDEAKLIREFSTQNDGAYMSEIFANQNLCQYIAQHTDYYKTNQYYEENSFRQYVNGMFSAHTSNRNGFDRKARRKLAVAIYNMSNDYDSVYKQSSMHIGAAGKIFSERKIKSNSDCSNSSEEGKFVANLFEQNQGQYFNNFMQDRNCRQIIAQRVGYTENYEDQAFVEYVKNQYKQKGFRHKFAAGLKSYTKKVASPFGFHQQPTYVSSLSGFDKIQSLSNDQNESNGANYELCNSFFQQESHVQELLKNQQVASYLAQQVNYQGNWQETSKFQEYLTSGAYRQNTQHGARNLAIALKHVNRSAVSGRSLNYSHHKAQQFRTQTVTTTTQVESHSSSSSSSSGFEQASGHVMM